MIAYGVGRTHRECQQPVGDTGHYQPRHTDAIVAAELSESLRAIRSRPSAFVRVTPFGLPRTRRRAASCAIPHTGSRSSSACWTPCPAARTRSGPRRGSSCDPCCPPTSRSSTVTRSSSTRRTAPCGSRSPRQLRPRRPRPRRRRRAYGVERRPTGLHAPSSGTVEARSGRREQPRALRDQEVKHHPLFPLGAVQHVRGGALSR